MRYFVTLGAREIPVDVTARADGGWDASIDGNKVAVDAVGLGPTRSRSSRDAHAASETLSIRVGERVVDLMVEGTPAAYEFAALGQRGRASVESEGSRGAPAAGKQRTSEGSKLVTSPMPGRVARVLVAPDDEVERGAPLLVIEAMKMENELRALTSGRVAQIFVRPGETVEAGAKLLRLA
jgi:glutaconyl-CoA/methylmalonyl-CoA decarboxylase subunit gamma